MLDYWLSPNPIANALIRDTQRRMQVGKMEAEIRVMQPPQAQDCWQTPEMGRNRNQLSLKSPTGSTALLNFWLLVSRVVKEYIFVVFRHQVSADLLQKVNFYQTLEKDILGSLWLPPALHCSVKKYNVRYIIKNFLVFILERVKREVNLILIVYFV